MITFNLKFIKHNDEIISTKLITNDFKTGILTIVDKFYKVNIVQYTKTNVLSIKFNNTIYTFALADNNDYYNLIDKSSALSNVYNIIMCDEGIGNQLFQFAAAVKYKKLGYANVVLDASTLYKPKARKRKSIYDLVNINNCIPKLTNKELYREISKFREIPTDFIIKNSNFRYHGWWQRYSFISDIIDECRQLFTLKIDLNEPSKNILNEIIACESVAIHVRRGDYLVHPCFYNIKKSYYTKAINEIKALVSNPKFFVFSNDIQWCKENFTGEDFVFVDINSEEETAALYDLELMKSCKHQIISNSTFAWWGAMLNDNPNKIVIQNPKWWTKGVPGHMGKFDLTKIPGWLRVSD